MGHIMESWLFKYKNLKGAVAKYSLFNNRSQKEGRKGCKTNILMQETNIYKWIVRHGSVEIIIKT